MKHRVNVYITHTRCNKCFKFAKRHLICVMPAQGCGKMHISQTPEANAIKCPRTQLFQERGLIPLITNHRFYGKINQLCGNHTVIVQNYLYTRKNIYCQDRLFLYFRREVDAQNHHREIIKQKIEIRSFKRIEHFSLIEEEIYEILSKYQTLFYC